MRTISRVLADFLQPCAFAAEPYSYRGNNSYLAYCSLSRSSIAIGVFG